ncbi:Rhomboid domain-containing protein 2 [Polyrhizophydium stewartii]|uniref:rhomboid protease n=1 Tax=Polyrhizophydium stewartii TaxID=2732419 RepID=A0ABR4NGG0_9FUNG
MSEPVGAGGIGLARPTQSLLAAAKAVPLGTVVVVAVATVLFVLNLVASGAVTGALCLAPTNFTYSPVFSIHRLIAYPIVHSGIVHFIVAALAFPFAASTLESNIGTVPFLYVFLFTTVSTAISYVFFMWIFSWIWPSWGLYPVNGLDIPFFVFLTIESLSKRGVYDFASRFGVRLPELVFPLPFVVVFLILLPYSSWIVHVAAIVVGVLYFLGVFEAVMLTNAHVHAIETSGMFAWLVSRPGFVSAPGAVALPIPGAFPDLMNPNEPGPASSAGGRGSIVDRIRSAFAAPKYSPLDSQPGGYHAAASQQLDVDPLLWDEDDDIEAFGAAAASAPAGQAPAAASPAPTAGAAPAAPAGP